MVPSRTLLVASFVAYVTAAAVASGGGGGGVDVVPLQNDRNIIGGSQVAIETVPWQVLLHEDDRPICGGVIISREWVLTAAHCFEDYTRRRYHIRVGSSYKFSGGKVYHVFKLALHTQYDPFSARNDIAALQTATTMEFGNTVRPAKLPTLGSRRVPVGSMLRVSGWGRLDSLKRSLVLMSTDIPLVDPSVCNKYFQNFHQESQLCAGTNTMKACHGDSGGPLVRGDVLVGLVSYGKPGCGAPVSAFTDVIFYRGWIKRTTGL